MFYGPAQGTWALFASAGNQCESYSDLVDFFPHVINEDSPSVTIANPRRWETGCN